MPIPAAAWRAWAETHECLGALRRRLAYLGIGGRVAARATEAALTDPDWGMLAILDATTRMVHAIVHAGGLRRGRQATGVFEAFFERARQNGPDVTQTIPEVYWTVRPAPPGPDGEAQLLVRGAVLVRVRGRRQPYRPPLAQVAVEGLGGPAPLSPELVAALAESPHSPGRELLRLLRADGLLAPTALVAALALTAGSIVVEVLLLRGLFDLGRNLGLVEQRLGAMAALLVFIAALLLLELPIAAGLFRLGRHLEVRLRQAFLEKIPRLNDRYFQSRPTSDMAERSHSMHQLRLLPDLGGQFLRFICELALMTAGIAWLDPLSAPVAVLAALVAVGLPLAVRPLLTERDLRVRTHVGALSRFYLDTLLGLVAVRTHGAERAVQREHESLLVEWASAGLYLQRTVVAVEGVQSLLGFGLVAWLLFGYLARGGDAGAVLLLAYWGLNLPVLGQEIALLIRQYPMHRNVTLRLLEPLGALEDSSAQENRQDPPPHTTAAAPGVRIVLEGVSVRAAGHTILTDIDLAIEAGSHVAIVGPSGAGKSSLVGLLLGWHRAATGHMLVDGVPLDGRGIEQLRQETAWVDPAVQLWNRSLLDNLRYGGHSDSFPPLATVIAQADLRSILDKLPDGLQTPLGEGGGLVSGGEGQRVRFGRALMRPGVRLVILDEPFRGLDREHRRELLARACWLLRLPAGTHFWHQMRHARLPQRLLLLVGAHTTQYVLWLLSWWVVGQGALQGRLELGWLVAWALLLLTLVPLRLLITWTQGRFAIGAGVLLKRRLLAGALRLVPEEICQQGAGQLLGRVIESEAVEALALSGGILGLVAGLELGLAAVVLSAGAGGGHQALLLLGWLGLTGLIGWRYVQRRRRWTAARLELTHDLVERMVGHRTRLAQEAPAHWHDGEDQALVRYLELARVMDRSAAWLMALVPRGWLLLGLLGLAPAFLTGRGSPATLAVGLGGALLAYEAFKKLATSLWHLAGAAIAWQQAAPLFHAAARPEVATPPTLVRAPGSGVSTGDAASVLEAHDLVFRYRDRGEPVLRGCSLRVCPGDRLLLEGPSGGGKSTLAALLTGLRRPESGLMLLGGFDLQTLGGEGWRQRVVAAPQFHDNHVFAGTFAFNLLMGRRWPPRPEDIAEAEALCHELGLEALLERMPAGLLQMVGDTGWRLSHGEQSRLYLARALLQRADVVVLDESFAALDPETLRRALRCVLARAATLLVIAHP